MPQFIGQDRCLVDANGRIKLSPRFLDDFALTGGQVVIRCLPDEGTLAVYPVPMWESMQTAEADAALRMADDIAYRRRMRWMSALSQSEKISNQGRITLPAALREMVGLEPGCEAVVTGCSRGIEIWSAEAWDREMGLIRGHESRRNESRMRIAESDDPVRRTEQGSL